MRGGHVLSHVSIRVLSLPLFAKLAGGADLRLSRTELGPTASGVQGRLGWIGDRTCRLHFLSLSARSTSRLASRVLMDSRRSYCFLPFASPSSTLAWPRLEK